jgi:hypothetical protein
MSNTNGTELVGLRVLKANISKDTGVYCYERQNCL